MSDSHPQPFRLRIWLVILAIAVFWASQAKAAPATEVDPLLARPAWAQGSKLVSRQEFSLLLDKVVRTRHGKPTALPPSLGTPWISRAQAVDGLIRAFGFDQRLSSVDTRQKGFTDITPQHPFQKAVLLAGQTKLINGYPDGTFRPDLALQWVEAATLLQTLRGWTLAMPDQTPAWVAEKQAKASLWYRWFDTARLTLTLIYGLIAAFYLYRAYKQPIKNQTRRLVTNTLLVLTVIMVGSWLNELGFVSGVMQRTLYHAGAVLSILAAFTLLKASQALAAKVPEPSRLPQRTSLKLAYVDCIDHVKGEIFVIDPVTKRKIMVVVNADTKVFIRQGQTTDVAYLSEIQVGAVVTIQGLAQQRGVLVSAQSVMIVAQAKAPSNAAVYQLRPLYLETQAQQRATVNVAYR